MIEGTRYTLRGRLLNRRRMGGSIFMDILTNGEEVQIYANRQNDYFDEVMGLNIGSFIEVEGECFITRTGHNTLRTERFNILHVPELQIPVHRETDGEVHNGVSDPETIRRRRYLSTITDSEERNVFVLRSQLIQEIRNFFIERDYLEVETPVLQPIYGGAEADPFITRFNSLDSDFYLRIAPELYLRRMLIGGYDRVFEIGRNFRNEGISNRHNPEFTFIEIYTAFEDYRFSMDLMEGLLNRIGTRFNREDLMSVERISYMESVSRIRDTEGMSMTEISEIFENEVEPTLISPTIVYDYPSDISPLALPNSENPEISERFEIFINGMEIGNAYSELNDVETHIRNNGDSDQEFITALRYGMPPSTGIGLGIDRLVMLLTNRTIRDVIYFPAMRS